MPGRTVELRGPADDAFVRLIRGATLSVASQAGFAVDPCDELRVAADEACNLLISSGAGDLVVVWDHDPPLLTITFSASDSVMVSLDPVAELVLTTMADHLLVEEGGRIVIQKKTPFIDPPQS